MFYKLHEKLLLRGWQKLPYAVVEQGVSRPLFINAKEMEALRLCNGLIDTSMPLSIQLGGFFSAYPDKPEEYDIPSMKNCSDPDKTCVCGHARMVMYISAEGRALPCMALSGMDIQEEFPLIPEIGLSQCITDSSYMRLIDTRATEVLKHNPECSACKHAMQCLPGCRASALETAPDDVLAIDRAACALFKGGWTEKIRKTLNDIDPKLRCRV